MIFDGEKLTDLLAPLDLNWKERRVKELALMEDLIPQLKKLAQGREISGLAAYVDIPIKLTPSRQSKLTP